MDKSVHQGRPIRIAELRHRPLLPFHRFFLRTLRNGILAVLFVLGSLGVGAAGYHFFEGLPWVDAVLNASMILAGMGPVATLATDAGKIFASVYALFSGVAFLTFVAVLFGPVIQRAFHRFHLELYERNGGSSGDMGQ